MKLLMVCNVNPILKAKKLSLYVNPIVKAKKIISISRAYKCEALFILIAVYESKKIKL